MKAKIYRLSQTEQPALKHQKPRQRRRLPRLRKRVLKRIAVLLIIMLATMSVVKIFSYQSRALEGLKEQQADLTARIENVKAANTALEEEKELLHTIEYIELIARRDFGMVAPGEKIFVPSKPQAKDD